MEISVQVSIYPLGTERLREEIEGFVTILEQKGLNCSIGGMATIISGDSTLIFPALQEAFEYAASRQGCVMVSTISNACPA